MNLSISNIAWAPEDDAHMYAYLQQIGFTGLEIAPTRIVPPPPYEHLSQAAAFQKTLHAHHLKLVSMQSIWYGRQENLFASPQARQTLINYTKQAINFAHALNCPNLVFGSPKNRAYQNPQDKSHATAFFEAISQAAYEQNTHIALEANPTIYHTNFINTTAEAFEFVRTIHHPGFKVNLDFGTIIQNQESLDLIEANLSLINHIHISEPYLAVPQKRPEHQELADLLRKNNYTHYVSIEMKNPNNLQIVKDTIAYVKEVFHGN